MSTSVKAQRPTRLSEDETLTSFEDWNNDLLFIFLFNLIFYLNQEKSFELFLKADATWTKSSDRDQNRGVNDAVASLKNFLGVIAGLAPPLLHPKGPFSNFLQSNAK